MPTQPYVPFHDYGPPLRDGVIDAEFIRRYGVTVPDNHYVVLGDNHAMSADSRDFGFVPQGNLRGSPVVIIWPFGERAGIPRQHPYPWITFPRLVVWGIVLAILTSWVLYERRANRRPIFKPVAKE